MKGRCGSRPGPQWPQWPQHNTTRGQTRQNIDQNIDKRFHWHCTTGTVPLALYHTLPCATYYAQLGGLRGLGGLHDNKLMLSMAPNGNGGWSWHPVIGTLSLFDPTLPPLLSPRHPATLTALPCSPQHQTTRNLSVLTHPLSLSLPLPEQQPRHPPINCHAPRCPMPRSVYNSEYEDNNWKTNTKVHYSLPIAIY